MLDDASRRPVRALILDDDEKQARVLAATLELQGVHSTILPSLDKAGEYIDRLRPGIVMIDLSLCGPCREHCIDALKRRRASDNEPLLLFARSQDHSPVVQGWEEDLGEVLLKPVKLSQVLSLVIQFKSRLPIDQSLKSA